MKRVTDKIKISEFGVMDVSIPIIKIGKGRPKTLLMAGMHGCEITGLVIIKRLLEELKDLKGELTVIPSVNSLAQGAKSRVSPTDLMDINRQFPGNSRGTYTQRLAKKVFEMTLKFDRVIDLHTMENNAPVTAIFMNSGSNRIKKQSFELIKALKPEIVWKLNPQKKEELEFSGSLGPRLADKGIVNFALEMPEYYRVTKEQLNMAVSGLVRILQGKSHKEKKRELTVVERKIVRADNAGLFTTKFKPMAIIKRDQLVGSLTSINTFDSKNVLSPFSGVLFTISDKAFLNPGDEMFSIGLNIS